MDTEVLKVLVIEIPIILLLILVAFFALTSFLGGLSSPEQQAKTTAIKVATLVENIDFSLTGAFEDEDVCRSFKFSLPDSHKLEIVDKNVVVTEIDSDSEIQVSFETDKIDLICTPPAFEEAAADGRYCDNNLQLNFHSQRNVRGTYCLCKPPLGSDDKLVLYKKGILTCIGTFR